MITLIDRHNCHQFGPELEQAWHLRHEVFVEEKGWEAIRRPDGREIDQFDDEHAVHMLCIQDGVVVGYQRMLPTMRPYLLDSVYPELCEVELPRSPNIFEWTRYAVTKEFRTRGRILSPVANELLSAIVEWGMDTDVRSIVIEMNPLWMLRLVQLHFRPEPLGYIKRFSDEDTIAVNCHFDIRSLHALQMARGNAQSVLQRSTIAA